MKKIFFLFFILTIKTFFAQDDFELLDAFVSGSTDYKLNSVQVIDFDNDGKSEIAYIFKKSNIWKIKIRTVEGVEIFENSHIIESNNNIKRIRFFKNKKKNYLATVSVIDERIFYLEIIDLISEEIIDTQSYKANFTGGNSIISGTNIKVYNKNDSTSNIIISYKENEYYDGPGFNGYGEYTKAEIFSFIDTLAYLSTLDKTSNVLPLTKISSGYHWTISSLKKNNKSEKKDCYIYTLSNSDTLCEKSLLAEGCYTIVSSDDSTNFNKPIIMIKSNSIFGFSLQGKIFEWKNDKLNNFYFNSTVAANWTLNNKFYFIYFEGHKMLVIDRESGKSIYSDLEISIAPEKILVLDNGELIFVRRAGYQTIAIYKLKNIDEIVSVKKNDELNLKDFILNQNYPNPFNPITVISYSLTQKSYITLKVFNILGKEIVTLVSGEQSKGNYNFEFNASFLPSGLYYYRLQNGRRTETKKMVLLK